MTNSCKAIRMQGEGRYAVSGDLVFASAASVHAEGEAAFGSLDRAEVDLAGVGRVDSAGLAVLLEWSIAARAARRALSYRNLPSGLAALAGISDVSEFLEATASAG